MNTQYSHRKPRVITSQYLGDPRPERVQKAPTPQKAYADTLLRRFD